MLNFRKFFNKQSLAPVWHFTKNTGFVGAKDMNVVCYLNESHLLFSCRGSFYVATSEMINKRSWDSILSAFDNKRPEINTDLIVITELNETCHEVLNELSLESETAGLHGIID